MNDHEWWWRRSEQVFLKFCVTAVDSLIVTRGPCVTLVARPTKASAKGGCRAHHNNAQQRNGTGRPRSTEGGGGGGGWRGGGAWQPCIIHICIFTLFLFVQGKMKAVLKDVASPKLQDDRLMSRQPSRQGVVCLPASPCEPGLAIRIHRATLSRCVA